MTKTPGGDEVVERLIPEPPFDQELFFLGPSDAQRVAWGIVLEYEKILLDWILEAYQESPRYRPPEVLLKLLRDFSRENPRTRVGRVFNSDKVPSGVVQELCAIVNRGTYFPYSPDEKAPPGTSTDKYFLITGWLSLGIHNHFVEFPRKLGGRVRRVEPPRKLLEKYPIFENPRHHPFWPGPRQGRLRGIPKDQRTGYEVQGPGRNNRRGFNQDDPTADVRGIHSRLVLAPYAEFLVDAQTSGVPTFENTLNFVPWLLYV